MSLGWKAAPAFIPVGMAARPALPPSVAGGAGCARGFAARGAWIAHGFDHALPRLVHQYRGIPEGKDAPVVAVRLGALEIGELGGQAGGFVGGDAQVILGLLDNACLELALGLGEPGFLFGGVD